MTPDKLESWKYWRKELDDWSKLKELTGVEFPTREIVISNLCKQYKVADGICPICKGWNQIKPKNNDNWKWCICETIKWQSELMSLYSELFPTKNGGKPEEILMSEMILYGNAQDKLKIKELVKSVKYFSENLDKWLVISGPVGTGKTRVLKSLAYMLYPIAQYLPATVFESKVFSSLKDYGTEFYISSIMKVPVLLFDDWGADYGSKLVDAKLRSVIDWRYNNVSKYPTVITTNKSRMQLMQDASLGDRVSSRILDTQISIFVDLKGMPDYRMIGR